MLSYITNLLFGGKEENEQAIVPDEYREFKLIHKENMTEGENVRCPVRRFRFEIPGNKSLGLPPGQHISIRATVQGEEVKRSYTPTTSNDDKGYFDLVIKVYPKGLMTQYLDHLEIGDTIEISGPKGSFIYEKNKYAELGMIAGGSGITPMLQIINEIIKDPDDKTKVSLIYGNITEQDIILRDYIDDLAKKYPDQFKVYHVLNEPPENWGQGTGFVTKDMIVEHLPEKGEEMHILLCGPPPMMSAMTKILKEDLSMKRKQHFYVF